MFSQKVLGIFFFLVVFNRIAIAPERVRRSLLQLLWSIWLEINKRLLLDLYKDTMKSEQNGILVFFFFL